MSTEITTEYWFKMGDPDYRNHVIFLPPIKPDTSRIDIYGEDGRVISKAGIDITINDPSPLTQFRSAEPSFVIITETPKKKSILKRLFTLDYKCKDMR